MRQGRTVAVIGAYGHTGRFVVAELLRRGYAPLLIGRNAEALQSMAKRDELEFYCASVEESTSLEHAMRSAAAVINCAGPFAETTAPVVEAALRSGVPYIGVAAELEAIDDAFSQFAEHARATETVVLPSMAFFGGLGDLLATHAMGDWFEVDEADIAYGLSSWHPTGGTLRAGRASQKRREGRSVRVRGGKLEYHSDPASTRQWSFPEPLGTRAVINELTMADAITFPRHVAASMVRTHMSENAIHDLTSPDTPSPKAVDSEGRSDQMFVVDARLRLGGAQRRAVAKGRDIYAVTAPLVVEATHRILTGHTKTIGVATAGEIFDTTDFLRALSPSIDVETFSETDSSGKSRR